jgi:hypothetical protein
MFGRFLCPATRNTFRNAAVERILEVRHVTLPMNSLELRVVSIVLEFRALRKSTAQQHPRPDAEAHVEKREKDEHVRENARSGQR